MNARGFDTNPPPSTAHAATKVRLAYDGFVSDAILAGWVQVGDVVRAGALLKVRDGRRYVLTDALRILGRANGETDPYGLTGRVSTLRDLLGQGATLSASSIRLGPAIYDVELGFIARQLASADESGPHPSLGDDLPGAPRGGR